MKCSVCDIVDVDTRGMCYECYEGFDKVEAKSPRDVAEWAAKLSRRAARANNFMMAMVLAFVGTCLGFSCNNMIGRDNEHDMEYLRRLVVRKQLFEPCKNSGFDDAMDVDCGTIRNIAKKFDQDRADAENRALRDKVEESLRQ